MAAEYDKAVADASFQNELDELYRHYVGRPSPLYFARRLTQQCGGAQIYLKREDLNHRRHEINNTLGQALLTQRMGKTPRDRRNRQPASTALPLPRACARFGFECVVYMGEEDIRRQKPNVLSMKLLRQRSGP